MLAGFAEISARVVLVTGLIYCKLFFRPGVMSQVVYALQLCMQRAFNEVGQSVSRSNFQRAMG